MMQNVESALYEAHIHGVEYFNDLKERVDAGLEQVMLPLSETTFEECCKRWWANMTGNVFGQPTLARLVELQKKNKISPYTTYTNLHDNKTINLQEALVSAKKSRLAYFEV